MLAQRLPEPDDSRLGKLLDPLLPGAWQPQCAGGDDGPFELCRFDSVRCHALRDIELCAYECPSFRDDEKLAISLIVTSAHGGCPALRACASALLGAERVEPVLKTAAHFAIMLETSGVTFALARPGHERVAPAI